MQLVPGLECNGARRQLFVVLHAFCQNPGRLKPLQQAIRDAYPDADIYAPRLPFGGPFGWLCMDDAVDVVHDLIRAIDVIVAHRGEGYEAVNFVGHSMGGIFARKIAIIAHGEVAREDADKNLAVSFEDTFSAFRAQPRTWAPLIKRIVLIAGMNRGWSTSSAMDWLTSVRWGIGILVGETLLAGKPIILDIRQGAVFSVQTRLQWLALMQRPPKENPPDRPEIVVVQMLGTIDDIVAPDDSVDYAVDDENETGPRSYFYLQVPNSDHGSVIDIAEHAGRDFEVWKDQTPEQLLALSAEQVRYRWFRQAICLKPDELHKIAVARDEMKDSLTPPPNWQVTDVVFVIHGIRDKGFWTQKIAREIKLKALTNASGQKKDFRSVTTSYGYFAMAPFILWWVRREKAEWLMDLYAETRAHYPRADFSYVGHSNGTYLVARALRDYPAVRFKRVVLAGSVVRSDYNWNDVIASKRVQEVLNYVATRDWVVAIFPRGMQVWPIFDLGGAGHDGFDEATVNGPVHEVSYIKGGHGAGHEERHWQDIAGFVVDGTVPVSDTTVQSPAMKSLGRYSTLILLAILGLVLCGGYFIVEPVLCKFPPFSSIGSCTKYASANLSATAAATRTLATIAYFWVVYIIINRV